MTAQEVQLAGDAPMATSDPSDIMMNAPLLAQIDAMATRMAKANATIPQHLKDNTGDCWAVIMQALQWRMNPFVVAQKTHLVSGKLGYEAQLVNAVVKNSGAIQGSFKYEFQGEGEQLQCRVGAVLKGEQDITWGEWLPLSSVTTRNSPLWKTNQKQQMGYLQCKNWVRLYAPEALLGVYTDDELREAPPTEREVGPRASGLSDSIRGHTAEPEPVAATTTDEAVIDAEPVQAEPEPDPAEGLNTFADVAALINAASNPDALREAHRRIAAFIDRDGNEQYRDELTALFKNRKQTLAEAVVAKEAEEFNF